MTTHRICMASDFFFPNVGGVEEHIFNLSQCLLKKNHQVVVLTHSYGGRVGIRFLTNGLKVYYLPVRTFYSQCVLPSMVSTLPLIRYILVRERITIVHGHSAFSTLAHETMMIARLMGLKTVFTDHSLFGFADTSAIVTNKFLELSLADCDHCICVSHIGKENTVLRARVNHDRVSVIPNAIDGSIFTPKVSNKFQKGGEIVIVVISRLVYRKGIDLLAQIILNLCKSPNHANVRFLIGGDGPKRFLLEDIIEKHDLADRIQLLGRLAHTQVPEVLRRGNIFLNTSLTEAYCMAIVEAASCGLKVVSTRVGGIPEVLPPQLIYLSEPDIYALQARLENAIDDFVKGVTMPPNECHEIVRRLYTWHNVTSRTEKVYAVVSKTSPSTLKQLYSKYWATGVYPFLLAVTLVHLMLIILRYLVPESQIDKAKDFRARSKNDQR